MRVSYAKCAKKPMWSVAGGLVSAMRSEAVRKSADSEECTHTDRDWET